MAEKTINVLLVEDDPGYARLVMEMCKNIKGAELVVTHVERLMDGIDILAREKIDVILLDLTLPDSEGIDTFLRIKGVVPEIPVVVLTGREDERLAFTAVKSGAQDFLFKAEMRPPFLVRSLRYAIERRRAQDALKRAHDMLEVKVKERTADMERINRQLMEEIEERKRAEEALKENEDLFRATIESTGDGIFVVSEGGKITHKNARLIEMWGMSEDVSDTTDDGKILAFFLGKLKDPDSFLSSAHGVWETTKESRDVLFLTDGRIFERRTSPLIRAGSHAGRVWSFTDVTARAHSERTIKESEERFRGIAERGFDIIYETDAAGIITYASPAVEKLTGRRPAEVVGRRLIDLASPSEGERAAQWMTHITSGITTSAFFIDLVKKDGSIVSVEVNAWPVYKNKEVVGTQGIARDISGRTAAQEEIFLKSQTDGLTGLFNRRFFLKAVEDEIKRANRIPYPLSLMLLDVDGLGEFNELNGRNKGDDLLKELAKIIRRCTRKDLDVTSRLGGDEFGILLPNSEKKEAISAANRIKERVARRLGGVDLKVGIASLDGTSSADALVAEAEKSMKLTDLFREKPPAAP